jgi:hypothetical protein
MKRPGMNRGLRRQQERQRPGFSLFAGTAIRGQLVSALSRLVINRSLTESVEIKRPAARDECLPAEKPAEVSMQSPSTARPTDVRVTGAISLERENTWTPHQMVRRAAAFSLALWLVVGVIVWFLASS